MKQILINHGWIFFHACMCGGSRREDYKHADYPAYEIRIRPTNPVRLTFTILNRNMQVAGPEWGYKLENKMKELDIWR